jgi:hypothetical protein
MEDSVPDNSIHGIRLRGFARSVAVTGVAALCMLGPPTERASGGATYDAFQCDSDHAGGAHDDAQWVGGGFSHIAFDDCPRYGGNGLFGTFPGDAGGGSQIGWHFDAPPGTYFKTAALNGLTYSHNGWAAQVFGEKITGGYDYFPFSNGGWQTVIRGGLRSLEGRLICALDFCPGSAQAAIGMRYIHFEVVDDYPPSLAASGSLLTDGARRGAQRLDVRAADLGGGLSQVYAVVNGVVAASERLSCAFDNGAAYRLKPCPSAATPSFQLNTEAYPFHDGPNAVQVCAQDHSTLSTSFPNLRCWPDSPRTVDVDNSCDPAGVAGATQLSAGFGKGDQVATKVASGRGATLVGRLTDADGNGVADATLCIKERTMLPGAATYEVGTVKTDSEGYYKYEVVPGPNRHVTVGYRLGSEQIESTVEFYSRVRPKLRLSAGRVRNGRAIRLFGKLPGPANADRVVVLQASVPGGRRWYTFRKAETDDHGRFEARYRFRNTTVTTIYQMRAVAAEQNGYPYLAGKSKKRRVRVKG